MSNYEFLKELASTVCSLGDEHTMDDGHIMIKIKDIDGWNSLLVEFDEKGNVLRIY